MTLDLTNLPDVPSPEYLSTLTLHCQEYIGGLEAKVVRLREAIDAWEMDPHNYSKRPCGTCRQMTEALGKPFGCVRYAITGMFHVPVVLPKATEPEPVQGTVQ